MSFSSMQLNPQIAKALSVCGYKNPTAIQSQAIPEIQKRKDVLATAQTGTGKTAAFVLPALDLISNTKSTGKPRVLILTPTRELATQITEAVARYGKFLKVNIVSLLGGMPYHKQLRELSRPVDIIVATPGRLMDHMERNRVDLSKIEMLILDEADRMLDMGFVDDVNFIANKTPSTRQTLLFSATVDKRLTQVIKNLLVDPVRIEINEKLTPSKIKQELYFADSHQHKMQLLKHLIENENIFKAIIFSATKINADRLAQELCDQEYPAAPLHGDLKQNQRNRTVEKLRRGKIQFLVATDVAARGIDISDLTHVINFDLPKFSEDYVHRIGRTGRAGKTGTAISFALPMDRRHLQQIERYIGLQFQASTIPGLEPKNQSQHAKAPSKKNKSGFSKPKRKRFSDDKAKTFSPKKRFSKGNDSEQRTFSDSPKKRFSKRDDSEQRTFSDSPKKRFSKGNDSEQRTFSDSPKKRFSKRNDSEQRTFSDSPKKRFSKRNDSEQRTFSDAPKKRFSKGNDSEKKTFSDGSAPFKSKSASKKPFKRKFSDGFNSSSKSNSNKPNKKNKFH